MVCKLPRAVSSCKRLRSTAERASDNCCVISAKERVSPPSSSLPCKAILGVKSPAATWRMPCASNNSGCANWLPNRTASSTAPKTAKNKLSVRVPMYMRRKPSRASARSWYSRLASCTSSALATKVGGSSWVICSTHGSSLRLRLDCGTRLSTLMRPDAAPVELSSKPSTNSRLSLLRTCLI